MILLAMLMIACQPVQPIEKEQMIQGVLSDSTTVTLYQGAAVADLPAAVAQRVQDPKFIGYRIITAGPGRTLAQAESTVECFCFIPKEEGNPECDSGGVGSKECEITDGETGDHCKTVCYDHTYCCARHKEGG